MNKKKLLRKTLFQLTAEEILFLFGKPDQASTDVGMISKPDDKYLVYGIRGIANLLNCSIATANRIKKSGIINDAIYQHNRKIVVDSEKALQLFGKNKENSKLA